MMKMNLWRTLMSASLCALMACSFTACDDDDEEGGDVDGSWDLSNLVVKPSADGTKITFEGYVKSDNSVTKFYAQPVGGGDKVEFTIGKSEKLETPEEVEIDGKTYKYEKKTSISGELPLAGGPYELTIDQRFKAKNKIILGQKITGWTLGTASANEGSYGSFKEGKVYDVNGAKANVAKISVILKADDIAKQNEAKLASATEAASADINTKCAAAVVNGTKGSDGTVDYTKGTIVTSDGCVAYYEVGKFEESVDENGNPVVDENGNKGYKTTISGIRYGGETSVITIDVSGVTFPKAAAAAAN